MTWKPSGPYLFCSSTRVGISALLGPVSLAPHLHHKLSRTALPRRLESLSLPPPSNGSSKSGSNWPAKSLTRQFGQLSFLGVPCGPASFCAQQNPETKRSALAREIFLYITDNDSATLRAQVLPPYLSAPRFAVQLSVWNGPT